MRNMSRKATSEYIGTKRRAYAQADRAKRRRILDEVCETIGYERKYANRLLTGSRKFREHKGRGKTYGDEVAEALNRVWREAGCPCLPYFKAEVGRLKIGERPQSTEKDFGHLTSDFETATPSPSTSTLKSEVRSLKSNLAGTDSNQH